MKVLALSGVVSGSSVVVSGCSRFVVAAVVASSVVEACVVSVTLPAAFKTTAS